MKYITVPVALGYILAEDGTFILDEDGTSKILAEGGILSPLVEMGEQELPSIPPGYRQKGYFTTTGIGGYLFHNAGDKLVQQDGGGIVLSDPAIPAVYIGEVQPDLTLRMVDSQ